MYVAITIVECGDVLQLVVKIEGTHTCGVVTLVQTIAQLYNWRLHNIKIVYINVYTSTESASYN